MTRLPLQPPLRFCILSVAGIVSRGFPSRVPSVVIHLRRIQSEFGVFRLGYPAVLELTFLGELGLELQIVADLGLFEFASCNNSVFCCLQIRVACHRRFGDSCHFWAFLNLSFLYKVRKTLPKIHFFSYYY